MTTPLLGLEAVSRESSSRHLGTTMGENDGKPIIRISTTVGFKWVRCIRINIGCRSVGRRVSYSSVVEHSDLTTGLTVLSKFTAMILCRL